ncbi:MAG: gliding motility protein, partial [Flavobacterium sp.]
MKTNIFRYLFLAVFCVFLVACSVRKDTFMSRNSHALATKYNILYNGGVALEKGVAEVKLTYKDNFWEILPVERMQPEVPQSLNGEPPAKNANFQRAEEKATKAIQKHSMNIDGTEKNFQIDEAYLMLGKARYYDQRFIPALDAFNYVLYKYPKSDKIYEAKIWREKTNIRLENDVLALNNLAKLLKEIKFKDQTFADANAIMAEAFL